MREVDMLKDILNYRISSQILYNGYMIKVRNPEIRKMFAELRDDEMRSIVRLQQRIERLESKPKIIAKIFTSKPRY